jgi:UrcA family protein
MRLSRRIVVTGVSCGVVLCALPACAARTVVDTSVPDGLPQQRVSYAGLDLNTAAGARILLRRLGAAAEQVCARPDQRDLAQLPRFRECYAHAVADGVRQVNQRQLTVLYQASSSTAVNR